MLKSEKVSDCSENEEQLALNIIVAVATQEITELLLNCEKYYRSYIALPYPFVLKYYHFNTISLA